MIKCDECDAEAVHHEYPDNQPFSIHLSHKHSVESQQRIAQMQVVFDKMKKDPELIAMLKRIYKR